MQRHELIEVIYKQIALACECKWQHLYKIRQGKIMLAYILTQYITREEVRDIYSVTKWTFLCYYLSPANKLLRIDGSFKKKCEMVKRNVNKVLWDYKLMNQNPVFN